MNYMKKINAFFILMFILFTNSLVNINAIDTYYDDTSTAGYQQVENLDTRSFYNGILYQKNIGNIITNSGVDQVSYSMLSGNLNEDTKVVTYAYQANDNSFQRASLSSIAFDYEEKHPGWKVMGISNGDQFTLGRGTNLGAEGKDPYIYQPYYPFIADGEKYFSIIATGGGGSFVGIKNEGVDPLVKISANLSQIAGLKLTLYDENNKEISKFNVNELNKTPGEGDVAIYSPYYTDINGTIPNIDASGNNVFLIGNSDLAYVSNSKEYTQIFKGTPKATQATDGFYGKGLISEIGTNFSVSKGQFAIISNDESLNEVLKIGGLVRAQYEYINEDFNNLESGIGFHTVQKDNGIDQPVAGLYNTNKRPRSLIGRKIDGTICLIVIDDYLKSYGTTGFGINALLKKEGIVEAYQMDGGGSAQIYVRENDKFIPVTQSADYPTPSQQRVVLNALLFVVRTEDISHKWISSDLREINLKVDLIESYGKDIKNLYIHMNNNYYLVDEEGYCKITNLSVGTEFKYDIYSENSLGEKNKTIYSGVASSAKPSPELTGFTYELIDDKISFTVNIKDSKGAIIGEQMLVDGKTATKKDGKYTFPFNLLKAVPIVICNYNLNDGQGIKQKSFYLFGQINPLMAADSILSKQSLFIKEIYIN
ncbi:MAG TPA: phosphodiester glycosidase family protein [Acholeplasmataceae bacterium]|nr:phosphodiester glycosidase family protein [Acholeplasmataceae bacterium]